MLNHECIAEAGNEEWASGLFVFSDFIECDECDIETADDRTTVLYIVEFRSAESAIADCGDSIESAAVVGGRAAGDDSGESLPTDEHREEQPATLEFIFDVIAANP